MREDAQHGKMPNDSSCEAATPKKSILAIEARAKLIALMKLTPDGFIFTDADLSDWVDRNIVFGEDGSMRKI